MSYSTPKDFMHHKDLYNALHEAEEYFVKVIEKEHDKTITSRRTEEIHWAVEGLERIAITRYKCMKIGKVLKEWMDQEGHRRDPRAKILQ